METKNIKDLLLRSITEPLSPAEQEQLDAALKSAPELREEQEQLLYTRDLVQNAIPPADAGFSSRVMQRLDKGRKEVALIVQLFPRVAAACVLVIMALSLFLYFEAGSLSADVLVGLEDLSVEEAVALTEY
jgi:anti-sigma factor RsiW